MNIADKCRHGVVQLWATLLQGIGNISVHVPAAVLNGDKARAGLAKTPGQQELFAKSRPVALDRFGILLLEIEKGSE